jgi:hypothetical protein
MNTNPRNVAHGLKYGEFQELPKQTKKKLVRLMARVAEQSYRRGFQQGREMPWGRHSVNPADFRFKRSLDKSPYTDTRGRGGHSAIDRLFMECGGLLEIGFSDPTSDKE